ncbi:MAG: SpoIIE family protein phosphatase [Treponema sp.]|nr:SpoIIE family protein phosphatase [Treponema sp.]MCL2251613.1 SpoIIE family protein phosphatase [Treponema sp.]
MRKTFLYLIIFSFIILSSLAAQDLFWEEAEPFTSGQGKFPVSAYSNEFSCVAWQEVSPNRDPNITATGLINIFLAVKEYGGSWQQRGAVAGPYPFSGTEPSIISLVIDNQGQILIATAAGSAQTEILISKNKGINFTKQTVNLGAENSVAPRLFVRADGGYLLFVTRGLSQSLSIYYSRSSDGITWSPFEFFTPENTLALNFLPTHASAGNKDIVFFQSLVMGVESLSTFQLFFKTSENGGRTWTEAKRFTAFNDPVMQTQANPNTFDNQRPHLTKYSAANRENRNNLFIVWERRYASQSPHIYCATIDSNGNMIGNAERVNNADAYCNNPIGFMHNNEPTVVWFDNRSGNNRIIMAYRSDYSWQNNMLSPASMDASFARPIVSQDSARETTTFIFWQTTVRGTGRIYMLAPDNSVLSPRITAVNFTPSRVSRAEIARVAWNIPSDTSGILGFSWTWSQDEKLIPPEEIMTFNIGNTTNLNRDNNASEDGVWYFSVRAQDFAGNWSSPARIAYNKKSISPAQVIISEPALDANGYLTSNSFNISWQPSADPYLAGYTWNLQYLGRNIDPLDISTSDIRISPPPSNIMGSNTSITYNNQDDGTWAFSAAAIDQAGNIGQSSYIIFRTDKFIPYTDVSYVDARQDEQGILTIRIIGRGFAANGEITSIVLEPSGEDVRSYTPQINIRNFTVLSDREIGGIRLENIEEGRYILRLEHSSRGWYNTASVISTTRTGTVKFGDYTQEWKPSWNIEPQSKFTFNPIIALGAILIILCLLGFAALIRGIGGIIIESTAVKQEAIAIITGDLMPMEKKQKITRIEKRGRGLSFKLTTFATVLVLLIVIMISIPMYYIMTNTQRETLLVSLKERASVLLEGLVSSTRAYLPLAIQTNGERGVLEMMYLPSQSSALSEANYITILGYGINSIHSNHVWATNDPDINSKIDTAELRSGVSRFNDDRLTSLFSQIGFGLNIAAQLQGREISESIRNLTQEAQSIPLNEANMQRLIDIQVTINSLEVRLTEILADVSGIIGSYPYFDTDKIEKDTDGKYVFYKPILYRQGADNNFFRGFVILEVSIESIIEEIFNGQMMLLSTIGIVAFIALLIGIIGAFIFSNLIIRPIRKLVSHIEFIRDTEDKSKLAGTDIQITSKDEIEMLGNTINDMTHGLVKAALAASDLSIGKEIQKKFIPLEVDNQGNKLTTGSKKTPHLDFFGYYEGAKGVSGDYFDYRDLDGRYYAIIKCDVAGKGIPAALIMIQVATMFLNYFKQWKPNAKGMKIEEVVYQINEFIETLGFKGRFAAFTLCLFDSETGIVRFCNAGDNIINYYDASEGRIKSITLPTTPATGVLPNFMIESTGGYKVQTVTIDKGDILLLFTDGIEEAKRKFRNKDFKGITCTEGPLDTPHENHLCGQSDEEMTPERVKEIINAVMAKKTYTLHKYHNPEDVEDLQFDFSSCEGNADDVIMAMVSVEKMFRCYKPEKAGEDSRILVDKKVDEFLKNHFLQYRRYCSHTREYPENPAYMYYTHVREDEQYDDLTILGIKRK